MISTCRRCSRVNPGEAQFCYFDGIALDAQHQGGPVAVGARPFPTPFVFPSGRSCRNFDELVRVCEEEWTEAQEVLKDGFLEGFLGGLGRADLAMAARQSAKETDRERGLDQLLNKLPVSSRAGPKLAVEPLEINLGAVEGERHFTLRLDNQGDGLLTGSIAGDDTSWLAFGDAPGTPNKLFQCRRGQEIEVHLVHKNLRASPKPVEGRILIEANGGTASVVVRLEKPVRPFSEGVLAGAKLPREIAAKAKAHPKEAAVLFEKGAVKDWYEANGWTYPVLGPSSSGLGAIQQFFEALGLVQAPRVTISRERLQFQGKPGDFLEQLLQVQTNEKRPVYAHASTNAPWLQIGRAILEGRTASIPIRVPSVPIRLGERLEGSVQVTANGNQRFTVAVDLIVANAPSGRPPTAPILEVMAALPSTPARPPSTPHIQVKADPVTSKKPTLPPPVESAPLARPALPFLAPVVPILILGAALGVVLLHDLLLRSTSGGVPINPVPLLALRFHDDAKPGTEGKDPLPNPTMRFGLLMHREAANGGFLGITAGDLKELQSAQLADRKAFKRLTFDEWGRSNNTCLKIEGDEILFGDEPGGKWIKREEPFGEGKQGVRSIWLVERAQIEVTQFVEIVSNSQTGRYDTCLIRYSLENKDNKPHTVGLRFLLDTYIGDNDGVPFLIPGDSSLCETLKVFDGREAIPDYIQAQENSDPHNPGTIARLQFRLGSKLESPSRVVLGGWPDAELKKLPNKEFRDANGRKTLWNVPLASMQSLHLVGKLKTGGKPPKDSAVTLYWDPQPLEAGKTRALGFTYGLGNISSGEGGHLQLTVGGRLVRDGEFTLTALVDKPKEDEKLTLILPAGLKVEAGSQAQTVPPVATRDAPAVVTWKLRAVRDGEFTLQVKSSNGQAQSQTVTIRSGGVFD